MKALILFISLFFSFNLIGQTQSDKAQIETTLNNYIDAFYKGDTSKLKKAIKPRLHKFGYWKNNENGAYEYYDQMTYDKAMIFVQKMKDEGRSRDENKIRNVEVLDVSNHIASAKVSANWGVDYVLLSKDNNKWMIEQVIWEGPYDKSHQPKNSTYYLIRHAEKDRSNKTNQDPHLNKAGKKRAKNWANYFKDVEFDAVYSTNYNRTKETASPTAKSKNLNIQFYDPSDFSLEEFMLKTKGKTVLIVGHSNTTPMFTNSLLGKSKYRDMADDDNTKLFKVTITKDKKSSEVLSIK